MLKGVKLDLKTLRPLAFFMTISLVVQVSTGVKHKFVKEVLGIFRFGISSPPIDGRANKELIQTVAKILEVAPSDIKIVRGLSSKTKTLEIFTNLSSEDAIKKIRVKLCGK